MIVSRCWRTHAWLQPAHSAVLEERRVPLRLNGLRTGRHNSECASRIHTGAAIMLTHCVWIPWQVWTSPMISRTAQMQADEW
jgi:hypothetical protein